MSTSTPAATLEVQPAGAWYLVPDQYCNPECTPVWLVYEEANGYPGLQRYDDIHDDTCGRPHLADIVLAYV